MSYLCKYSGIKLFFFSVFFFDIAHSVVDLEAVLQMLYCSCYIAHHYPLEGSALKGILLFKSMGKDYCAEVEDQELLK